MVWQLPCSKHPNATGGSNAALPIRRPQAVAPVKRECSCATHIKLWTSISLHSINRPQAVAPVKHVSSSVTAGGPHASVLEPPAQGVVAKLHVHVQEGLQLQAGRHE